jgi:hypothetical protein
MTFKWSIFSDYSKANDLSLHLLNIGKLLQLEIGLYGTFRHIYKAYVRYITFKMRETISPAFTVICDLRFPA